MPVTVDATSKKVLVTGFGPFLDITTNPSWEVVRKLPTSLTSDSSAQIEIIVPKDPTPAAYHKILAQCTELRGLHRPDLVVHVGLDVDSGDGVFKLERSAPKEGYHDVPDVDRKVFTRAENKKLFSKAAESLVTTLDIDGAHSSWEQACRLFKLPEAGSAKKNNKSKQKRNVSVQLSDDVGTYVCGFQYYVSMLEAQKSGGKRDIVFLHIPRLESEDEVRIGVMVTEEFIRALFNVMR